MRQDVITNAIKIDKIICEFMRRCYYSKGGYEVHKKNEIRNNARELARLLREVREVKGDKSCSFMNIMQPNEYKNIIEAVKRIAGLNEETQQYKTPELARKLGLNVTTCTKIVQSLALEENDSLLSSKCYFFFLNYMR